MHTLSRGNTTSLEIVDRISKGQGKLEDLDVLISLAQEMERAANCGLGQTAAVPIRDMLKHFRTEVEAHIRLGSCPTGICEMLPELNLLKVKEERMVQITINGKQIEVPEGTTVLRAAEMAGIYIPRLCDHKELTPYGGCRLCIVEVQGVRVPMARTAHAFIAVAVLAALVNAVGPAIEHLNPRRYDRALVAIDARFFGPLVAAWTHAGGRPDWLTDAASLAYASYYVLPIACAAILWRRRRLAEFDRLVFSMAAVLLASYAAYFIAPAAGPRVPQAHAQAQLGGGAISAALRAFLRSCERNELDAFPSGHTATSLVFLFQAWPMFRRQRFLLAAAVAAIVFSTVYLSLHYVIDVVAGAALAALVTIALRRFAPSSVEELGAGIYAAGDGFRARHLAALTAAAAGYVSVRDARGHPGASPKGRHSRCAGATRPSAVRLCSARTPPGSLAVPFDPAPPAKGGRSGCWSTRSRSGSPASPCCAA